MHPIWVLVALLPGVNRGGAYTRSMGGRAQRSLRWLVSTCLTALVLGALAIPATELTRNFSCPVGSRAVTVAEAMREFAGRNPGGRDMAASLADTNPDAIVCSSGPKNPEPIAEVFAAESQRAAIASAPSGKVPVNALALAVKRADALGASSAQVQGASGRWSPYGKGPLIANDPRFDSVNGAGFVHLAGRIDSLAFDPVDRRLFATVGTGGIWTSADLGERWRSIGNRLPTQVIGAVGWSRARGGSLIAASGEPLMG